MAITYVDGVYGVKLGAWSTTGSNLGVVAKRVIDAHYGAILKAVDEEIGNAEKESLTGGKHE